MQRLPKNKQDSQDIISFIQKLISWTLSWNAKVSFVFYVLYLYSIFSEKLQNSCGKPKKLLLYYCQDCQDLPLLEINITQLRYWYLHFKYIYRAISTLTVVMPKLHTWVANEKEWSEMVNELENSFENLFVLCFFFKHYLFHFRIMKHY